MNILIVEDNPTNRKLLHVTLAGEGHEVFEAGDGEEALAALAEQRADAIISDILMPNMDGYRLCYEIRRHTDWRNLPFIFYTATYTSPSDEKLALDLGADAYLRKPASTGAILETLHEVLQRTECARPKYQLTETDVLKEYSERLVVKLEAQNIKLETRTKELEQEVAERKRVEETNRKLQAQLHLSQKMDALGTLAGGVAHDFNNLIPAIIGNAELAMADLPSGHPVLKKLSEIVKAGARARDLVNRILTFSRQRPQERRVLKLQPVVEEALQLLRVALPAMIEIRTDFQADVPTVLADATQIHQIVMNLGINASHAMNKNGCLEVRLETIAVDAALARSSAELHEGTYVRLTVSDNGCGMDRSTLARIFEPFFTTKLPGQGTGLGLAVVHGIMMDHDGAITVDSKPGEGTAFQLYFPVVQSGVPKTPIPAPEIRRGSGQRILFVDDEAPLVYLVTESLKFLGYHVSGFTRPEEALEALRAAPGNFDFMITDLSMPVMPGPVLARQALQIRPDLPIVIATGYIRPEDIERARHIGVRDLILKPSTVLELSETMHRLLGASQTERPNGKDPVT
ncbi:histidine kinase [Chthoniobacter flavus Ellin428]|uniref:histidine kinase n=1 Tax=Chthoniobacter flavus Ellin428 TaxID=497964 RepID=B4D6V9_9BACT|nr:response regulator [Chthoniobacter flavus]EDY17910.1 histidine kinase [Chthoniobacter flavus Ellin428]TCO88517.1 phospho-acceptor domain-containing protein [Chthoniobacter flavus]